MRRLLRRLTSYFGGGQNDARLDEEIQTHLDLIADDFMRQGMSAGEARAAARRAFGGVDQMKAAWRDERGFRPLDALLQDVRLGVRVLTRDRGFALTAILVLGLGIGVNNMMFSLLYAHTLRPLPIADPEQVLHIGLLDDRPGERGLSWLDLADVRAAGTAFEGIAAYATAPMAVGDEGRAPDRFEGMWISANATDLLRTRPVAGRTFSDADDRLGAAPAALLSERAWQARYGGDPAIVGRRVLVNGSSVTVIGILPDRSGFPVTADVWLPLAHQPGLHAQPRNARSLRVFGRVAGHRGRADAVAQIEQAIAGIAAAGGSARLRARVMPISERHLSSIAHPAWRAFLAAGFLVFLVSCANVANLLLARAVLRTREIAIRGSLGASRRRVVGQLLIESAVLAAVSGLAGLLVSMAGMRLFRLGVPDTTFPYWLEYTMDTGVFAALVAVTFGAVLVFGLVPALQASRLDVGRVLKDGGRGGTPGRSPRRLTTAFITAQLALTVVLLAQMLISLRTVRPDVASDRAIDTTELLTASVTLPADRYRTPEAREAFWQRLSARLDGIALVDGHTVASTPPLGGGVAQALRLAARPLGAGETAPDVTTVTIGPRYFATLGVPLLRGRDLDPAALDEAGEAIVNQRFVEVYGQQHEMLGERIALTGSGASGGPAWLTIVGVAADVRQSPAIPDPVVYLARHAAPPPHAALIVRSRAATTAVTDALRAGLLAVDAQVPLYRVRTMRRAIDEAEWNGRLSAHLLNSITLITVIFSIAGLYAVTAHAVSQRTQEIGIRMALGAGTPAIGRLILRRAAFHVALGLGAGLAGAIAWGSAFDTGSAAVTFFSAGTLLPVVAVLVLVTAVACLGPVRRAIRLAPAVALRE